MAIVSINGSEVSAQSDQTLFECAEAMGVRVPTSCLKNGKCRECMVEVEEGAELLSEKSDEEQHLTGAFRLSCRAKVANESGRISCRTLRRGALQIVDSGDSRMALKEIDPAVTRDGRQVLMDGQPVGEWSGPLHGLAIDLGTTTVVLRLIDLESGELKTVRSFENPQRFGGSDVMARIQYDTDHPGRLLQRTLLGYLTHAIEDLDCEPESIFEIVVAGNSTMRDLFFGLNVESIGQVPYRSLVEYDFRDGKVETTSLCVSAKKLRLPANSAARVYSLPLISGHVGADTSACLLAIGIGDEEETVALMDIGTNTEFVVGNRDGILVSSCPAGPAFEGGVITCGMPGLEGAIESLKISDSGEVSYKVIGDGPAVGICGSGLVDLLSELLRTKRMSELGRYTDESGQFVIDEKLGLVLTEEDISQLAQAKGANVAGGRIVLKESGLPPEEISRFYLAGGFAGHLDLAASRRIGLIPDFPEDRIERIGNASVEGATTALLSVSRRQQLDALVQKAKHVSLESHGDFFDYFVDGCQFMPADVGFGMS